MALSLPPVAHLVREMAQSIAGRFNLHQVRLVGIHTAGFPLAKRLAAELAQIAQIQVPVGALDIALYRDDLGLARPMPELRQTDIPFELTGKIVILVDDVLFSGRTIRAALSAVLELGRPQKMEVAVLVDRGHRELPIMATVVGVTLQTQLTDHVRVYLTELEGRDEVVVN